MKYAEFIELAKANYTKGGDSFYECWDERTFAEYEEMSGKITKKSALRMFKDNADVEAEYDAAARWGSGIDQETIDIINKENEQYEARKAQEEKEMAKEHVNITEIEVEGIRYTSTRPGYYYKRVDGKNIRIPKSEWEQAFDEYIQTMQDNAEADEQWDIEAEVEARKDAEDKKDRETEENFNKKETKKARKSKDIAHSYYNEDTNAVITLTAKQVDFIKHLPDTSFWEQGLDSCPWCDVLAEEIGGQFAGKPMTVGAMISTLREKNLLTVGRDTSRQGKPKFMQLTDMGKQVAKELGLE